ncbi:MAG: sodium:proton antiporter, partial [Muribaculaceae bacterium]|nr:sodium:proton antiporter [Muribaculaceae bacterium]
MDEHKLPHPLVAIIPVVILIALLAISIALFGSDSLSGGSQISLIIAMAVCVLISMIFYHVSWKEFEKQMAKTMSGIFVTLLILLSVGMLAGSW